jgi:hypothetical protein
MATVNAHPDELVTDCPKAAAPPLPDYLVEIGYISMEQVRDGEVARRGWRVIGGNASFGLDDWPPLIVVRVGATQTD